MRLNRVLQLTAGVAIAMAATVFTISCSGEDGSSGSDGAACVVKPAGEGNYNVVCGGTIIGSLVGGTDGAPGNPGGPGGPGAQGNPCTLGTQQADGSYPVYCGGSTTPSGSLSGCTYIENPLQPLDIVITCGGTTFGFCANLTYDPSEEYCPTGATPNAATIATVCGTAKVKFNPAKQYCGYDTRAALVAKSPTVLDLCTSREINTSNTLANAQINPATEIVTNEYGYDIADVGTFTGKYCEVTVTVGDSLEYAKAPSDSTDCEGKNIAPNKDSWKGEYCGYASKTVALKSMVNNACADGEGPDKDAFGKKYCWMELKTSKFSTISDIFCDVASGPAPLNKVEKIRTNASDWKSEYCGYENKANFTANNLSVLKGICDDGSGPNSSSWTNDYCQADKEGITTKVGGTSAYCLKSGSSFEEEGADTRVNEGTWKNQYCGYSSKEEADALEPTVQTGVCDNGIGPNASSWSNEYCQARKNGTTINSSEYCGVAIAPTKDYAGSVNKDTWKNEYCGYASKENFEATPKIATVLTGVCNTDGSSSDVGPNAAKTSYTQWLNEYCQASETGVTTLTGTGAAPIFEAYCVTDTTGADYSVADAAARINENTWKSEYCGFASKENFEAETKVFSRLTGICGNDGAPNAATSSYTAWTNDYCQVKEDDRLTGTTTKVGGGGASIYCSENSATEFADLDASARLNENTWKGEYCFADNVKGTCTGGKVPASSSTTSDAPNRCVFFGS